MPFSGLARGPRMRPTAPGQQCQVQGEGVLCGHAGAWSLPAGSQQLGPGAPGDGRPFLPHFLLGTLALLARDKGLNS